MNYRDDDARPIFTDKGPYRYDLSHETAWPIEYVVDSIENDKFDIEPRGRWAVHPEDVGTGRLLYVQAGVSNRGPYRVDVTYPKKLVFAPDLNSISEEDCDFLYGLVRTIRPRRCLETGTHKGRSTLAIATALAKNNQGQLWTVDMHQYVKLDETLPPVCHTRVRQIVGSSPEVFTQAPFAEMEGLDFAFLDGGHDGKILKAELEYVDAHRGPVCYVVCDNALDSGWPGVRSTLDEYTKYKGHVTIQTMSGMDVICMRDEAFSVGEGASTMVTVKRKDPKDA